jgi:hypothetical protein
MRHSLAILRHPAIAAFGLALFMLGSHYCLVGALMPGGMDAMACHAPVAVEAGEAHAAMPACHGKAPSQKGEDAAPASQAPCCVALTPVVAPQIDKLASEDESLLVPVAFAPAPLRSPATAGLLLRAPPESPPLAAAPRAHASPRAPPIA